MLIILVSYTFFQIVENSKKVTWECEYVGFMLKKKFFIFLFFYREYILKTQRFITPLPG